MIKYGLQEEQITAIQNILAQHQEVEQAILYGSRAKGTFKPASDIDLVLKGEKLNLTILNKIANELDDLLLPYIFDLSVFHEISNEELVEHIERVGVVIYENRFLSKLNDWKEFKLGDVTMWRSGGTPSKNVEKYWNGSIPWISAKTLLTNRVSESSIKITQLGLENGSRLASVNSILLLVRGSGLFNRIPVALVEREVAFNQDIKEIIPDSTKILPKFLLYWLEASTVNLNNKLEETGIGAGKFDTEILKNLKIQIPSFNTQSNIIKILNALDDKIELNRQTNQTLEEIAKTLFQEMCVPKGDELPEGWRVGKLGDICEVNKKTVSKKTISKLFNILRFQQLAKVLLAASRPMIF